MSIRQTIERVNKRILYALLRLLLRNRQEHAPIDLARVSRVLLLRNDAIGDMIVTTPAIHLIRHLHPSARVDVVASRRNAGVVRYDRAIGKTFIYDDTLGSLFRLVRQVRRERYDCIFTFVLHKTTKGGVIANLLGGRDAIKVAMRNERRGELYRTFFNLQIPVDRDRSTMAEIQTKYVCDAFGWRYDSSLVRMEIVLDDAHRERAHEFHRRSMEEGPFVLLNISAGNPVRTWPPEKNRELLGRILAGYPDLRVVVVSAPADSDIARSLCDVDAQRVHFFPPTPDFLDVCAIVERSVMVVSPDTSIVHVGAAFARPVLLLCSRLASFMGEWLPFGVPYRAVITAERAPLETLGMEEVIRAFEELYDETLASRALGEDQ